MFLPGGSGDAVANDADNGKLARFAVDKRDFDKLLREHAPDDPTRTQLKQLMLDFRSTLNAGLPLRAPARRA